MPHKDRLVKPAWTSASIKVQRDIATVFFGLVPTKAVQPGGGWARPSQIERMGEGRAGFAFRKRIPNDLAICLVAVVEGEEDAGVFYREHVVRSRRSRHARLVRLARQRAA
jgi:hypothetical protein